MGGSSKKNAEQYKDGGPKGNDAPDEPKKPCKVAKVKTPKAETVQPQIVVTTPSVWFHATIRPERNEVGSVQLKATRSGDKLNYKGRGKLTADNANVAFYSDAACRKPIDPQNGDVTYSFSSLKKGVTIYYKGLLEGATGLTLTLEPAKDDRITVLGPALGTVSARQANVITPVIEFEYKVALFDRKPHTGAHNADNSNVAAIPPTPTYLLFSVTQTKADPVCAFTGAAALTGHTTNLDMFTTEAATTAATDLGALPHAELTSVAKAKRWARGKLVSTAPFTLTLTLTGQESVSQRFAGPATGTFNVAELKMVLHKHNQPAIAHLTADPDVASPDPYTLDKQLKAYHDQLEALNIPDQIAMTDPQKTGDGRFLHVQSGDGSFDRARLVLSKLVAAQWPAETNDHTVSLGEDFTSGRVTVFKNRVGPDAPDPITVADLKAAEKVLWVEGTTDCDKRCDVRLQVQLDRPVRDLPKDIKKNGDWARLTVVTIETVKVEYTPDPSKPEAWGVDPKRFYINFKDDPDGRDVTIRAKLTKNIPGVKIHFMLAPSPDNMKAANWGVDLPDRNIKTITDVSGTTAPTGTTLGSATVSQSAADVKFLWKWNEISADLKHKDKDTGKRQKLPFMSEPTKSDSGNAYADKVLRLSRFGGDVFTALAYIEEDPHLAKYVEGHTTLETRKPRPIGSTVEVIEVWRKFWYERVAVAGFDTRTGFRHQDLTPATGAYEDVKTIFDRTVADHVISAPTLNGITPQAVYPRYMVVLAETDLTKDGLVVARDNKAQFFPSGAPPPKTPLRVKIVVCDAQWDPAGNTKALNPPAVAKSGFASVPVDSSGATTLAVRVKAVKKIIDPPLQGGTLFVSGSYVVQENINGTWTNLAAVALTATDVFIPYRQRAAKDDVFLKWPAAVTDEWTLDSVAIANGGTGCTDGMVGTTVTLTAPGATQATVKIDGQTGGVVTACSIVSAGRYQAQAASSTVTGGPTGLTLTPTWKALEKKIKFQDVVLKGAASFLGECNSGNLLAVYDPAEAADFTDTVIHECAHAFFQAPTGTPPGPSSTHATIPAHPNTKNLGQGNHCWYEAGSQKTKIGYVMTAVTVAAGGTGYTNADLSKDLTLAGGESEATADTRISAIAGGVVTGVRVWRAGKYTTKPANPVTVGGSTAGTGLQINVTWAEQDVGRSMLVADKPCVMYDGGPQHTGLHKFCSVCHPYLLAQDMSKFK